MPDTPLATGRILSISSRGRMTLDVAGCLVIGQLLDGGGGWIGDRVEGDMRPGLRAWRHRGSAIVSVVQVLLSECAALPSPSGDDNPVAAQAA
jgi:hypothetical protein